MGLTSSLPFHGFFFFTRLETSGTCSTCSLVLGSTCVSVLCADVVPVCTMFTRLSVCSVYCFVYSTFGCSVYCFESLGIRPICLSFSMVCRVLVRRLFSRCFTFEIFVGLFSLYNGIPVSRPYPYCLGRSSVVPPSCCSTPPRPRPPLCPGRVGQGSLSLTGRDWFPLPAKTETGPP